MKKITLIISLIFLGFSSRGQGAGTLMFGTNLLKSSPHIFDGTTKFDLNLQTKFAFFATDEVAMGLCLETGLNKNSTVPFGLTFNTRYYAGKKEKQVVKLFMEGGIGLADNIIAAKQSSFDGITPNNNRSLQFAATAGFGIDIFPVNWFAVEIAPEYRYVTGKIPVHRVGLSAGFKVFIGEKAFKNTFPNKFRSMY